MLYEPCPGHDRALREGAEGAAFRMEPEAKERLGTKWTCYSCGIRFYDLKRPEPTCPKCQADQRESPVFDKKPTRARATRKKAGRKKITPKRAKRAKTSLAALDDENEKTVPPEEDKVKPVDQIDPNEVASELAGDE